MLPGLARMLPAIQGERGPVGRGLGLEQRGQGGGSREQAECSVICRTGDHPLDQELPQGPGD